MSSSKVSTRLWHVSTLSRRMLPDPDPFTTISAECSEMMVQGVLVRRPGGPSHQLSRGRGLGGVESQSKRGAWAVTVK
ncbi:hypothetical protein Fmac_017584 [Flemingia macrophylla]|uniref:Uncharacterized protein n=1 Tax=Flemingia macrophylla TaxID=520843 RepID=A0ABD1M376_9FABA